MSCSDYVTLKSAQSIAIASAFSMGFERTGIINTLGRTLAEDVCDSHGEIILKNGLVIGAREMAAMASLGINGVAIACKPRVSVITTGSDVIDVMEPLQPGKMRNVNRYDLAGRILSSGCDLGRLIHCNGDQSEIENSIQNAFRSDVIVISATSIDSASNALQNMGSSIEFAGVQIDPASKIMFGSLNDKSVIAVPSDYIGSIIGFELIVRPVLNAMLGRAYPIPMRCVAKAADSINVSSEWSKICPGKLFVENDSLIVVSINDSSLKSMAEMNSIIEISKNVLCGDSVGVIPIPPLNLQ